MILMSNVNYNDKKIINLTNYAYLIVNIKKYIKKHKVRYKYSENLFEF